MVEGEAINWKVLYQSIKALVVRRCFKKLENENNKWVRDYFYVCFASL
jgi:hypothetical protein